MKKTDGRKSLYKIKNREEFANKGNEVAEKKWYNELEVASYFGITMPTYRKIRSGTGQVAMKTIKKIREVRKWLKFSKSL